MIDFDGIVLGPLIDDIFGEPVTFVPNEGPATDLPAVFDAAHIDRRIEGANEVVTTRPALGLRLVALPRLPAEGEAFLVRGLSYIVAEPPRVDGMGGVHIFLHGPTRLP